MLNPQDRFFSKKTILETQLIWSFSWKKKQVYLFFKTSAPLHTTVIYHRKGWQIWNTFIFVKNEWLYKFYRCFLSTKPLNHWHTFVTTPYLNCKLLSIIYKSVTQELSTAVCCNNNKGDHSPLYILQYFPLRMSYCIWHTTVCFLDRDKAPVLLCIEDIFNAFL